MLCPYAYTNKPERAKCKLSRCNNYNNACHHSWDGEIESIFEGCGLAYCGWTEGKETVAQEASALDAHRDRMKKSMSDVKNPPLKLQEGDIIVRALPKPAGSRTYHIQISVKDDLLLHFSALGHAVRIAGSYLSKSWGDPSKEPGYRVIVSTHSGTSDNNAKVLKDRAVGILRNAVIDVNKFLASLYPFEGLELNLSDLQNKEEGAIGTE